ncbi:MAG: hypothetical protein Q8P72_04795, partial [Candidatus Roizmanbacteria bacterium]|nr:hypothetical protein [Candidatus Roizmanbacteria bacterium]
MSPENTVSSPLPDSTTGAIDFSKRAALRDIRDLGIGALGFRYFNSDFLKFKERQQATTNFTIPIVLGEPLATQELQKTVMIQDVNERELPDAKSTKMGMANTGETIDILDNDVADYGSNAHWDRVGVHERIETGPKAGEETGAVTIAHIIDATNGKPTAKTTTETIDLPLPTPKSIFQTSDLLRLNKPSVATGGSDNFNASVQTAFGIPSRTDRSSGKLKVVNPVDTDTA